jgi:hypothetical protein
VSTGCDVIARCTSGRWEIQPPGPGTACPTPNHGIGPGCPSSYPNANGKCDHSGLECDYPDGRCACGTFGGPVQFDAGPGVWQCETHGQGCPVPRPRLGSACSLAESVVCDYGACFLPGGTTERCVGGVWQEELVACPATAK